MPRLRIGQSIFLTASATIAANLAGSTWQIRVLVAKYPIQPLLSMLKISFQPALRSFSEV